MSVIRKCQNSYLKQYLKNSLTQQTPQNYFHVSNWSQNVMAGTKCVTIHFPQFCCINVFVNSRRLPFISVERCIQIVTNESVKQRRAIRLRKSRSLEQALYVAIDSQISISQRLKCSLFDIRGPIILMDACSESFRGDS